MTRDFWIGYFVGSLWMIAWDRIVTARRAALRSLEGDKSGR